jgi:excisionase family DNA binding protein
MYRVKAVAEMFDVSESTIYRAIESGKLDALKVAGINKRGSLRIPASAIEAFRESCAEAAYQAFVVDGESAEGADPEADQAGGVVSGEVA